MKDLKDADFVLVADKDEKESLTQNNSNVFCVEWVEFVEILYPPYLEASLKRCE